MATVLNVCFTMLALSPYLWCLLSPLFLALAGPGPLYLPGGPDLVRNGKLFSPPTPTTTAAAQRKKCETFTARSTDVP